MTFGFKDFMTFMTNFYDANRHQFIFANTEVSAHLNLFLSKSLKRDAD